MTTSSRVKKEMKQNKIQQLKITNSLRHETIALRDIFQKDIFHHNQ